MFQIDNSYQVQDVIETIQDLFRHVKILKEINVTAITLIPKISSLVVVGNYRSIACCYVIYKTITKLICTKFGKILLDLVSDTGAFINRRSIINNILLCHNLVKRFRSNKSHVKGLLVKVDFRKAYDFVA